MPIEAGQANVSATPFPNSFVGEIALSRAIEILSECCNISVHLPIFFRSRRTLRVFQPAAFDLALHTIDALCHHLSASSFFSPGSSKRLPPPSLLQQLREKIAKIKRFCDFSSGCGLQNVDFRALARSSGTAKLVERDFVSLHAGNRF